MAKRRAGIVLGLDGIMLGAYLILAQVNDVAISDRVNALAFSLFPLVGALLVSRHPANPVGYLLSVLGLAVLGASTLFEYAALGFHQPEAGVPFSGEAAWMAMLLWTIVLPILVLILLHFPDGRLPGPRWKLLAYFIVLITLPVLVGTVLVAGRNRDLIVAMELGQIEQNAEMAALFRAYDIWNLFAVGLIILALVSFIFRFLRARGIERQQLKWFVFGLSTIPVSMILEDQLYQIDSPLVQGVLWTLNIISIGAFPVVMLIAITRYRLYDIDLIIRRTLLYSALTLTLALIYFGVVLVMQRVFTWQFGEQPAIMIVFTTLLIAALFQPLRRRFQTVIDRRFYRSKYNAEQTLQRFAAQLQSEVDLDEIERYFIEVVDENLQPTKAEFWHIQ
jgi:hypothetical protein